MPTSYRLSFLLLALASLAAAVPAKDAEEDPWLTFVPGHFALVGRGPDGGAPYAGEATLEVRGQGFRLRRTVAGKTAEAEGMIEVPSPPGEGKVLRFRWQEGAAKRVMTCLVSSDLDNYARLSCVWVEEGTSPDSPGLEAYFSSEAWDPA